MIPYSDEVRVTLEHLCFYGFLKSVHLTSTNQGTPCFGIAAILDNCQYLALLLGNDMLAVGTSSLVCELTGTLICLKDCESRYKCLV